MNHSRLTYLLNHIWLASTALQTSFNSRKFSNGPINKVFLLVYLHGLFIQDLVIMIVTWDHVEHWIEHQGLSDYQRCKIQKKLIARRSNRAKLRKSILNRVEIVGYSMDKLWTVGFGENNHLIFVCSLHLRGVAKIIFSVPARIFSSH